MLRLILSTVNALRTKTSFFSNVRGVFVLDDGKSSFDVTVILFTLFLFIYADSFALSISKPLPLLLSAKPPFLTRSFLFTEPPSPFVPDALYVNTGASLISIQ